MPPRGENRGPHIGALSVVLLMLIPHLPDIRFVIHKASDSLQRLTGRQKQDMKDEDDDDPKTMSSSH